MKKKDTSKRITHEAIEAWKACDYERLHMALGLAPYECSPLPLDAVALGVKEGMGPRHAGAGTVTEKSQKQALELQRELVEVAGWPDVRAHYEKNLADARASADYAQRKVDDPRFGGYSYSDPAKEMESRKDALARSLKELAWRKSLLDGAQQ